MIQRMKDEGYIRVDDPSPSEASGQGGQGDPGQATISTDRQKH